ncbi:MAG: hypothetical protein RLZZ338_4046, partial [Cyanobacteriota bacterium]
KTLHIQASVVQASCLFIKTLHIQASVVQASCLFIKTLHIQDQMPPIISLTQARCLCHPPTGSGQQANNPNLNITMENTGLEPETSAVRLQRSTN